MEQYISKSAVLAEIESLLDKGKYHEEYDCAYRDGNNAALYALKGRINALEVKEVDEIPARIEVNKYHNRFISSWAGLCQYDNFRIGEEIKILLPKNKAQKGEGV